MHSSQSECLFLNDWDRIVFEESTSTELEDGLPGDPRNPDTTRYHATMLTKPIQETLFLARPGVRLGAAWRQTWRGLASGAAWRQTWRGLASDFVFGFEDST